MKKARIEDPEFFVAIFIEREKNIKKPSELLFGRLFLSRLRV
jgi:hypothetical protein